MSGFNLDFFYFYGISRKNVILIGYMVSYFLQHGSYMKNNSVAALSNMLVTSKLFGNISCFNQATSQVR